MEAKKREEESLKNTPHLMNINSDPMLTGSFKKALKSGSEIIIGKANKESSPDIVISGVGIANAHCKLGYNEEERKAVIIPNEEDPEKFTVKVNGEIVKEPTDLNHGDRVLVGMHHYYLYRDPAVDEFATYEWE